MLFQKYLPILLLFVSNAVFPQSLDESFHKFSSCSAEFFKSLKTESVNLKDVATLEVKGDLAWFKVANRSNDKENSLTFTTKPTIAGYPVLSYLDEASDLESMGLYYYWGFKVEGKYSEVMEKITPLVFENRRLNAAKDHYSRTEIKVGNSHWLARKTTSGSAPRSFFAERVFLIEPDDKNPNITKLLCSVQGAINAQILSDIRPDIDSLEYPLRIQENLIHTVNLSTTNIEKIKKIAEDYPIFKPKFKEINFIALTKGRNESTNSTKLVVNKNGLIDSLEDLDIFKFQRQYISNLIQTKYRFMGLGSSATIALADELTVEFPKTLNGNEKITYFSLLKDTPQKKDSKNSLQKAECTFGDQFDAKTIHANITGQAWFVACIRDGDGDKKAESFSKAFIEDLGIFIDLTPAKGLFGSPQPSYIKFDITH